MKQTLSLLAICIIFYFSSCKDESVLSPVPVIIKHVNAPKDLRIISFSDEGIVLQWNDSSDNEILFEVEQGYDSLSFWKSLTISKDVFSVLVSDSVLRINSYWFRVRAISENDTSKYSNKVKAIGSGEFEDYSDTNWRVKGTMDAQHGKNWNINGEYYYSGKGAMWARSESFNQYSNLTYTTILKGKRLISFWYVNNTDDNRASFAFSINGESWVYLPYTGTYKEFTTEYTCIDTLSITWSFYHNSMFSDFVSLDEVTIR